MDGRFRTSATNLGYDEDNCKEHGLAPARPAGPPDNLVLVVENYLEGEAYYSLFVFTQMICSLIMIAIIMLEIRHIFTWRNLNKKRKEKKVVVPGSFDPSVVALVVRDCAPVARPCRSGLNDLSESAPYP